MTIGVRSSPDAEERRRTLNAMSVARRHMAVTEASRLNDAQLDSWLKFAEVNSVGPLVAHVITDALGNQALGGRASKVHRQSEERMTVLMAELDAIGGSLAKEGIPLVALKNAGIARGLFPCAGCCPMGDIDVLLPKSRFLDAHRLVGELGYHFASRGTVEPADLQHGLSSGGTEYVKAVGGQDVWLELQWRPVAGRWLRPDQEPDGDRLLSRSQEISGTAVRLLHPVDNMQQVALHTAKHSFVRAPGLRLHTDVDRLAYYSPPDWQAFVDGVQAMGVTVPCYFSLSLATTLLGAQVPSRVLDALSPPRWKREVIYRWLNHIDLFYPNEVKFSRPEMVLFHGLLYDDTTLLLASLFDTDRSKLGWRNLRTNLQRGRRRVTDILTRYQA